MDLAKRERELESNDINCSPANACLPHHRTGAWSQIMELHVGLSQLMSEVFALLWRERGFGISFRIGSNKRRSQLLLQLLNFLNNVLAMNIPDSNSAFNSHSFCLPSSPTR